MPSIKTMHLTLCATCTLQLPVGRDSQLVHRKPHSPRRWRPCLGPLSKAASSPALHCECRGFSLFARNTAALTHCIGLLPCPVIRRHNLICPLGVGVATLGKTQPC